MDALAARDLVSNAARGIKLVRMLNFDRGARLGPIRIDIAATSACNYHCCFCGAHSSLTEQHIASEFLSEPALDSLLSDLRAMRVRDILFSGNGEPLLSPTLLAVLPRYIKYYDVEILTNGARLEVVDQQLFDQLKFLTVSLNSGNGQSHQVTHGYRGENLFPRIVSEIERLLGYRRAARKIKLNYVITRDNYAELEDFIRLARKWDVSFMARPVSIIFPELQPRALTPEMLAEVNEVVDRNLKANTSHKQTVSLQLLQRAVSAMPEPQTAGGRLFPCYYGYIQGFVEANGDVLLCPSTADHPLGNINADGFRDIWQRLDNQLMRLLATRIPDTGDVLSHFCYDCQNVQYHSLAFHNVYSKIPILPGRLLKRIERMKVSAKTD
jgi:MoaA/NifB/PqqE/SkfB family radical SAM enzyme